MGQKTSTSWKKGQSGNPDGKANQPSLRKALREALAQIDPKNRSKTYYKSWAESLRDGALTNEEKLEIAKFLEGSTPALKDLDDEELDNSDATDANGNTIEP